MRALQGKPDNRKHGPARLTEHAQKRVYSRGFPVESVEAVLAYGRISRVRGAEVHAIGRKEVAYYAEKGVDLRKFEGVHVVCSTESDGVVITAYRNHSMRGLRPRRKSHTRRRSRPAMKHAEMLEVTETIPG